MEAGSSVSRREPASISGGAAAGIFSGLEVEGVREQFCLTEIYGSSCARLVRVLKDEGAAQGKLADYLSKDLGPPFRKRMRSGGLIWGARGQLDSIEEHIHKAHRVYESMCDYKRP